MQSSTSLNRRRFLKANLLGSAAFAATSIPALLPGAVTKTARDPFHGLKMGVASYSLRNFTLDQAIAMTRQLGVKYITLKDMHLSYKSTTAELHEAHRKIDAAGLVLMGGGVIYMKNNAEEVRQLFQYAKDAGMPTMVSSPDIEALDLVEQMAKEFDIRVAIHNHGPGDNKYPSPLDVWRLVKDRDARLGICMDVGHTVRIGQDPIAVMQQCAPRLYDYHIKDVNRADKAGNATEVGRGIIDIVAVLKALVDMKYQGHVALEYETNAAAPLPGMIESFAYMRGVLDAMG